MSRKTNPDCYEPRAGELARIRSLWRHMRRLEAEGHLSAVHQLWDVARLKIRRGIGPAYYLSAKLYRRELHWKEKLTYLGGSKYDRLIRSVNPAQYDYLTRNKLETYRILTAHHVPVATIYGVVGDIGGRLWEGEVFRSPSDLLRLVGRLGIDRLCFKYVSGTRGRGFYRVRILTGGAAPTVTIEPDGEVRPLEAFFEELRGATLFDGYLCQAVIEQDDDLARLNPSSVNTARTWMIRPANDWEMAYAVLRIGDGTSSVDNLSRGGIGAPVEIDTGRLSSGSMRTVLRRSFSKHPTSGAQIDGTVLPWWPQVKALCRRTAALFPFYRLVSVDIAFGREGPLVVELGTTPDEMQGECEAGVYPLLRHLAKQRRLEESRAG